jgi:hypothetical protein
MSYSKEATFSNMVANRSCNFACNLTCGISGSLVSVCCTFAGGFFNLFRLVQCPVIDRVVHVSIQLSGNGKQVAV